MIEVTYGKHKGLHSDKGFLKEKFDMITKDKEKLVSEVNEINTAVVDTEDENKSNVADAKGDTCVALVEIGMGNVKYTYYEGAPSSDMKFYMFESRVQLNVQGNHGMGLLTIDGETHNFNEGERVCKATKSATKDTEHHKVLMKKALYDIYKLSEKKYTKFKVVTACSLDSYITDKGKAVKDNLFDAETPANNKFRVKECNVISLTEATREEVELEIVALDVTSETLTGLTSIPGISIPNKNIVCVDMGYLNNTVIGVRKGRPDFEHKVFGSEGMLTTLKEIVKKSNETVKSFEGLKFKEDDVQYTDNILQDLNAHDGAEEYLKPGLDAFCDRVDGWIKATGFTPKSKDLVIYLMGGGCATLSKFLKKGLKDKGYKEIVLTEDSIFANLKGLVMRSLRVYPNINDVVNDGSSDNKTDDQNKKAE